MGRTAQKRVNTKERCKRGMKKPKEVTHTRTPLGPGNPFRSSLARPVREWMEGSSKLAFNSSLGSKLGLPRPAHKLLRPAQFLALKRMWTAPINTSGAIPYAPGAIQVREVFGLVTPRRDISCPSVRRMRPSVCIIAPKRGFPALLPSFLDFQSFSFQILNSLAQYLHKNEVIRYC